MRDIPMSETFVRKPIYIRAMQYTGDNMEELCMAMGVVKNDVFRQISSLKRNDWVIKDEKGTICSETDKNFRAAHQSVGLMSDNMVNVLNRYTIERELRTSSKNRE